MSKPDYPTIEESAYRASWFFRNPHFNTIYPHLFRRGIQIDFKRHRIETSDGDFVDLDMVINNSQTAAIMLHGLEGSSNSHYMKGMARALISNDIDVIAMNQKGCSGESNNTYSSYHSGKTDDLEDVVHHIVQSFNYKNIILLGFSLGGNICLKYTGEKGNNLSEFIKAVIAISVPCDLTESAKFLKKWQNKLYMKRFMKMLKKKALDKYNRFPKSGLSLDMINNCRDFESFDNMYTAPAHGFNDALHYWTKNSSKQFIGKIRRSTLLISAKDDPFFGPLSQPIEECQNNDKVLFNLCNHGGHVGFAQWNLKKDLYHEKKTINFINQNL